MAHADAALLAALSEQMSLFPPEPAWTAPENLALAAAAFTAVEAGGGAAAGGAPVDAPASNTRAAALWAALSEQMSFFPPEPAWTAPENLALAAAAFAAVEAGGEPADAPASNTRAAAAARELR